MEVLTLEFTKPSYRTAKRSVIDVSFISIVLILPVVKNFGYDSHIICLVKPQFE